MRKMHSKEELEALASGGGGISYSTEEQDTGLTWIDGKKIYQRTFAKTGIPDASTSFNFTPDTIRGINIIEMQGVTTLSSGDPEDYGTTFPYGNTIESIVFNVVYSNGVLMGTKASTGDDTAIINCYLTILK